jgi:hypothetical protein
MVVLSDYISYGKFLVEKPELFLGRWGKIEAMDWL